MKTKVCNVKVQYIQPQYENLAEWMKDPDNVYVGRGGVVFIGGVRFPGKSSVWANPFKIGRDGNRQVVIRKYRSFVESGLSEKPEMKKELKKLRGKNLGCWCVAPGIDEGVVVCHGQVLAELCEGCSDGEE
jgi:hypothetical protein